MLLPVWHLNDARCCTVQDYPLAPLEDDCKLLGALLDDCLKIEVGDELFEKVVLDANAPPVVFGPVRTRSCELQRIM